MVEKKKIERKNIRQIKDENLRVSPLSIATLAIEKKNIILLISINSLL